MSESLKKLSRESTKIMKEMEQGMHTYNNWNRVRDIEIEKRKILLFIEQTWRLKSRATWLREGDKNTKYFHAFATGRKNANAIWHIEAEGESLHTTKKIQNEAVKFFLGLFMARKVPVYEEQLWPIEDFPIMFEKGDRLNLIKIVTTEDTMSILKSLKPDKSSGPDGWTPNFFIHFSDYFIEDITELI